MPEPLAQDPQEEALEQPYFPMDPNPDFRPASPDSTGNPVPTLNDASAASSQT